MVSEHGERALELDERAGDGLSLSVSHLGLSYVELAASRIDAAEVSARSTLAVVNEQRAARMFAPLALTLLSEIALQRGDPPGAREHARRALELARAYGHALYVIPAGIALARAQRVEGDEPAAAAVLDTVQANIAATEARLFADDAARERELLAASEARPAARN